MSLRCRVVGHFAHATRKPCRDSSGKLLGGIVGLTILERGTSYVLSSVSHKGSMLTGCARRAEIVNWSFGWRSENNEELDSEHCRYRSAHRRLCAGRR